MSLTRGALVAILLLFAGLTGASASQQTDPRSWNQHRINEFAARCVTAQRALSPLKAGPLPGETAPHFQGRMQGYIATFAQLSRDLAPLRALPPLRDRQPQNIRLWMQITSSVNALPSDVKGLRAAWLALPKLGEKARFGAWLISAGYRLQTILEGLRDARP